MEKFIDHPALTFNIPTASVSGSGVTSENHRGPFKINHNEVDHQLKIKSRLDQKWWPERKHIINSLMDKKHNGQLMVQRLHLMLQESKTTVITQETISVSVEGEVGKTYIAKYFANHYEGEYDHIIWFDCGEGRLNRSFQSLAEDLEVENISALPISVLAQKCFSLLREFKCLFIYDNAKCYIGDDGIHDVLPTFHVRDNNLHSLITSRNQGWGTTSTDDKINTFCIDAFSEEESLHFVKNTLEANAINIKNYPSEKFDYFDRSAERKNLAKNSVELQNSNLQTNKKIVIEGRIINTTELTENGNVEQMRLVNTDIIDSNGKAFSSFNLTPIVPLMFYLKNLHLDSAAGSKFEIAWNSLPLWLEEVSLANVRVIIRAKSKENENDGPPTNKISCNIRTMQLQSLEFVDEDENIMQNVCVNDILESCCKIHELKVVGFNKIFDLNRTNNISHLELHGVQVIPPTVMKTNCGLETLVLYQVKAIKDGEPIKNVETSTFFNLMVKELEIQTGNSKDYIIDLAILSRRCTSLVIKSSLISFSCMKINLLTTEKGPILTALRLENPQVIIGKGDKIKGLSEFIANLPNLNFLSYYSNDKCNASSLLDIQSLPQSLKVLELRGSSYKLSSTNKDCIIQFALDKLLLDEMPFKDFEHLQLSCILKKSKFLIIKQIKNFNQMKNRDLVEKILRQICSSKELEKIAIGEFQWREENFKQWTFLQQFGIEKESDYYMIECIDGKCTAKGITNLEFDEMSKHKLSLPENSTFSEIDIPSKVILEESANLRESQSNIIAEIPINEEEKDVGQVICKNGDRKIKDVKHDDQWSKQEPSTSKGTTRASKKSNATATERITSNFEYLVNHLTNVFGVAIGLVGCRILTIDEKEAVTSCATEIEKNDKIFTILVRKDLNASDLQKLISILDKNGNAHVAARLQSEK